MSSWIDLQALWQIVVVSLLAGAGLPALFAVGLRLLAMPGGGAQPVAADSDRIVGGSRVGIAAGGACFAIVLGAIGWGIYLIVAGS